MGLTDIVVGETSDQYKAKMDEIAKFKGVINDLKLKYTDNEENKKNISPDDLVKLNVVLDDLLAYLNNVANEKLPEVTKRYNETMFSFNNLVNTLEDRRSIYDTLIKYWVVDFENTKKTIYDEASTAGKEPSLDEDQMNNINTLVKNFKKNTLDIQPYITKDQLKLETAKINKEIVNIVEKKVVEIEEENNKSALDIFLEGGRTFIGTVILFLLLGIGILAGKLLANDFIVRPAPYRVLYFIYGMIFFFLVIPYYWYRLFKGTTPKIYCTLPIIKKTAEEIKNTPFYLSWLTFTPDMDNLNKDFLKFKELQRLAAA